MKPSIRTPKSVYLTIGAGFALGAVCMAAVFSGKALPQVIAQEKPAVAAPRLVAETSAESMAELRNLDTSFANLAEYAGAAIVDIKAVQERAQGKDGRRVPISQGEGSGFIFRADGYIMTNDHVVGDATKVTVSLKDGREFKGTVTRAPFADIALVKIDAKDLPTLSFADSSKVRPGQFAMALGAPFGLENTVTVGHVSALHRSEQFIQDKVYADLIQTDASINRGNSGGPLINIDGQVVGVNTAIFSPSGVSAGIGFAIPSNQAKFIGDILLEKGKVTRAYLGVRMESLKEFEKKDMKLSGGAKVVDPGRDMPGFTASDTPAGKAGLRPGDIIVQIGDRKIDSSVDLRNSMLVYAPGTDVDVKYVRDGKSASAKVKLGAAPEPPKMTSPQSDELESPFGMEIPEELRKMIPEEKPVQPITPDSSRPRLGVSVADVTAEMRKQFGVPEGTKGAVVLSVSPGSPAATLGMKPGDVITKIGSRAISSSNEIVEVVSKMKSGESTSVAYSRFSDGATTKVEATVTF